MHDEALARLPEVLDARRRAPRVLVGHSDGGTIALVFAGSGLPATSRLLGLTRLSPFPQGIWPGMAC